MGIASCPPAPENRATEAGSKEAGGGLTFYSEPLPAQEFRVTQGIVPQASRQTNRTLTSPASSKGQRCTATLADGYGFSSCPAVNDAFVVVVVPPPLGSSPTNVTACSYRQARCKARGRCGSMDDELSEPAPLGV